MRVTRLASRTIWRWSTWLRTRRDDPRIIAGSDALRAARKAHKATRAIIAEQRAVRLARMREQFGELASVLTLFVGGYAAYCIANPLDAMASELRPWSSTSLDPVMALIAFLIIACVGAAAWLFSAIRKAAEQTFDLYDDPDTWRD